MKSGRPTKIAIEHDDYSAKYIGINRNGMQFFLTTPFEPANKNSKGCEYIALFTFDSDGSLVNSSIDVLGPRGSFSHEQGSRQFHEKLASLGEVDFRRIEIEPFSVHFNGIDIGLIVREPEDEDDVWAVEMLPGNYMAFFEPWDSGEYDT